MRIKPIILLGILFLSSAWFAHGTGSYIGPGDLLPSGSPSYDVWVGLRAFKASYIGSPAAIICDSATQTNCKTAIIAANGYIDTSGLTGAGQPCAGGSPTASPTCVVTYLYDQATSNHNLTKNGTHIVNFVFDGPNGYPAMYADTSSFDTSRDVQYNTLKDTGVPYITSVVTMSTGDPSDTETIFAQGGEHLRFDSGGRLAFRYGGSDRFFSGGTRNKWHSITFVEAGGGQGAPGQGNSDPTSPVVESCLRVSFATDRTGNITTSNSTPP